MRMWGVSPKFLCRKHLLGEHLELHMFIGTLNKNKSLKGYIDKGLVEVHFIKNRHEDLVKEMMKRNYNHNSPLNIKVPLYKAGKIDIKENLKELYNRCEECRERMKNV